MPRVDLIGRDWLVDQVAAMPDGIDRVTPVSFNEEHRYLPEGASRRPGYIRYSLFPFLREILECFDPYSPVREVNLMKGVQTGYTTLLESVLLYLMGHIKTSPVMFITAEKDLANMRMDTAIMPMIQESDMEHLIQSSDSTSSRKTGKTKDILQWQGGGYMIYQGAQNANKMRSFPVPWMLKDELDGWPRDVGQDGTSDKLTDARLSTYWDIRKILRGSTPLLEPSMIGEAYEKGDQRKYLVLCKKCSFPQELRQETVNEESGLVGGFKWEMEDGSLLIDSVRYCCQNCGEEHFEHDKEKLFSEEHGAHWQPTARPFEPGIRSYHLPAFYSPFGFRPWYKCVTDYLDGWDPVTKQVVDIGKYQEYYNNVLGRPFKVMGSKVGFMQVSGHRRAQYRLSEVPNEYANKYSGSKIMFLTCQVDVHKRNLAVSVMGWAQDMRCYVIDYWRFENEKEEMDCADQDNPQWERLRTLIEDKVYEADDGTRYRILLTLIDAGYANDTVSSFCAEYASGVYPILGRERPAKNQRIKEFDEFKSQAGGVGFRILVDHYKDRIAPVLRREWVEEAGLQRPFHFNAPVDISDKQLKELTVETRREKTDDRGNIAYEWYRPGNARNELWDLLVYGHAAVEIWAWQICIQHFELETIDWKEFWIYAGDASNDALFGRIAKAS